jgi:hypothetical protein
MLPDYCPCCGGPVNVVFDVQYSGPHKVPVGLKCYRCGLRMDFDGRSEKAVVYEWNDFCERISTLLKISS